MKDQRELYKKELLPALDRLWKENGSVKGFRYFEDSAYTFSISEISENLSPEVVVLGTGIPEALLRAFHIQFRYLLGGSHAMTAWSDDLVPRDTDPVSRSILGALHAPEGMCFDRSLFLIPIHSDSMRKIAYLLKEEGHKTFTLDIPPDHADTRSVEQWENQLIRMVDAIAEHTHKRISLRRIRKAVRSVTSARCRLNLFIRDASNSCHAISGAGKMLIRNSYYFADDLEDWKKHIEILHHEIQNTVTGHQSDIRPKILLTGSPIFFPNYKIPFLIEDVGLSIQDYIDVSTIRQEELLSSNALRSTEQALHAIAASSYKHEASAAYTSNDALVAAIYRAIRDRQVDGIIFHILKGQIEYDFELEHMMQMFESHDIPVFRLETDYQYQDIEQLRIRLEAFCEMLSQAHCSSAKKAV